MPDPLPKSTTVSPLVRLARSKKKPTPAKDSTAPAGTFRSRSAS